MRNAQFQCTIQYNNSPKICRKYHFKTAEFFWVQIESVCAVSAWGQAAAVKPGAAEVRGSDSNSQQRWHFTHVMITISSLSALLSTCVAGATPSPRARSPAPSTPSPTSTPWPASTTSGASRERRGECSDSFSHPCLQGAERIQDITQLWPLPSLHARLRQNLSAGRMRSSGKVPLELLDTFVKSILRFCTL